MMLSWFLKLICWLTDWFKSPTCLAMLEIFFTLRLFLSNLHCKANQQSSIFYLETIDLFHICVYIFSAEYFFYFFIYYFYLEILTEHNFFYMKIIYILLDIKCVRFFCTAKQEIKINPLACLLYILSIHVNQSC
jgi:hypothetical protein